MKKAGKWSKSAAALSFLAISLISAGCESQKPDENAHSKLNPETPKIAASAHENPNRQTNPGLTDPPLAVVHENEARADEDKPSQTPAPSPDDKTKASAAASDSQSDTSKPVDVPNSETMQPYSHEKPLLLGLAIGDPKEKVIGKFGNPNSEFVMDDGKEPVTVFEYETFAVGFDKSGELEFIDIQSADIDPGLGGIRLGDKATDAIKLLGEPDTNSTYVLSYHNEGTVLKLDIDPKTEVIQSIKLFAGE